MNAKRYITLSLALLMAGSITATAATITFREGESNDFVANYAGTSDTTLGSNVSSWNGGALEYFSVGRNFTRRAIMRFDLSSLSGEVGAVDAASLTLHLSGNATTADLSIAVYQLTAANAEWEEGAGNLTGIANAGEATWSHHGYNTEPWAGAPGATLAGVDFISSAIATFIWKPGDTSVTFDLTPELVEQWITNPSGNAGLIFVATNGAGVTAMTANFASSEHTDSLLRPLLSISYQPIPEPGAWALAALGVAGVGLYGRRRR